MAEPLVISSFSGGRTSAYMTRALQVNSPTKPLVLFANTGCEYPETLDFVDRCDREWGLGVVWLESVTHHGVRKASTHKIVTYETASRDGAPFEDMIRKYGIPNKAYPHCTRELKLNPIYSYLRELEIVDYSMAIGIRADEGARLISEHERGRIIYPLTDRWPTIKSEVLAWWREQPFDLGLDEYQGNCAFCWKKSLKKHFMLIKHKPSVFDFTRRMESEYPLAGHNTDGTPRVFFRQNLSTNDLFDLYAEETEEASTLDLDTDDGCAESCDIHALMKEEQCGGV